MSQGVVRKLSGPAVVEMRWEDLLFAHWAVDPAVVARTLPDGLAVDSYDGRAYLSVVAFAMPRIGPPSLPIGLSFHELNLRTYVVGADDAAGIYFYNLDADSRLGVRGGRWFFRLPYYDAELSVDRQREVRFRSRRIHRGAPDARFDATYAPTGDTEPVEPGSLDEFLAERYRLYTEWTPDATGEGGVYYSDVTHDRWRLAPASVELRQNTLLAAHGFERPEAEPLCHYGTGRTVRGGRLHRE
jgi:uncharacterized protein YqjF (DUF2071 family)